MQSHDDWLTELRSLAAALTYPSESDEPLDVFVWPQTQPDPAAELRHRGLVSQPILQTPLDAFFRELIPNDPSGGFARLRQVIEQHLAQPTVLRVGEVEVDVYVIGRAPGNQWAGLHTRSIET